MIEKYPSEIHDPYLRLGVNPNASYEEIKKAYRKLALYWHPDRNKDKKRSHIEFIAVSEAFDILSKKQNNLKSSKGTYKYYDELFKKFFDEDIFSSMKVNDEVRAILEIFKEFEV